MLRLVKYLIEDLDRHGNVRRYVRRPGFRKVRIRAAPGSPEFWCEYLAAVSGAPPCAVKDPSDKSKGTLLGLCGAYFASTDFGRLHPTTRVVRRRVLEDCCRETIRPGDPNRFGDCPLEQLTAKGVKVLRDRKAAVPEAANSRVKALRAMLKWAVADERIQSNPARDVPQFRTRSDGHHAWSSSEIAQFMERHPSGTKARLACCLLFFTGQRVSDVVRFGPDHLIDGRFQFTQAKNESRSPVTLQLPLLPELEAELGRSRPGGKTFLLTSFGKPFTAKGFGNWFRERCDEAGLPDCSAHGLRKAGATIAAENGATASQLQAIFGWRTFEQPNHYTKSADQKRLAREAMRLLVVHKTDSYSVPLRRQAGPSGTKKKKKATESRSNEKDGGLGGNRTPVQGFAVLCVATPPRGRPPRRGHSPVRGPPARRFGTDAWRGLDGARNRPQSALQWEASPAIGPPFAARDPR